MTTTLSIKQVERFLDISAIMLAQHAKATYSSKELDGLKVFVREELRKMDNDITYMPRTKDLIRMLERGLD